MLSVLHRAFTLYSALFYDVLGIFKDSEYWDVEAEYAKDSPTDILCKFTVYNRGAEEKEIHIIPQLWFRYIILLIHPNNYSLVVQGIYIYILSHRYY